MKLKSLTFGTLAASTVIFASTVVAPAQAATVTGTLNFTKTGGVNSITASKVDFVNTNDFFKVDQTSGSFVENQGVTILRDLNLSSFSAGDFLKVENGVDDIFFNITGFAPISPTVPGFFHANVFGNFRLGSTNTATKPSSFVLGLTANGSKFTTVSIAAVPTPALLPGLVGMGIAALRKRKSDGLEADLESAEA
jgi:hypothetical protein